MPDIDLISFGRRDRFEIAVSAPRRRDRLDRQPEGYGWSLGRLRIVVGGRVLTEHVGTDGHRHEHVSWYLLPVMEWLAAQWVALLHEEEFGWQEPSTAAAATIVPQVMASSVGSDDAVAIARYGKAQAWRNRHALRAAAQGGLLPDLYIRRFLDSIELSWTNTPPLFAPDGFRFVSTPGYAACSVDEVAGPLWEAINFIADGGIGRPSNDVDRCRLAALVDRIASIRALSVTDFARARVAPAILAAAGEALGDHREAVFRSQSANDNVPAIAAFSPALAMYGGLNPEMGREDVAILSRCVLAAQEGFETPRLAELVRDAGGAPRRLPPLEGQSLAEELLERLDIDRDTEAFDIHALLGDLGIDIVYCALATDTVRGVALAGQGFRPTILVNTSSYFNDTSEGRRFTLAHELCHILYDRGQARRVGISSGPWAPAAVEKRANAFAAMLLMPPVRVAAAFDGPYDDYDAVTIASERLQVTRRALTEHLFNIFLIDEPARERLRKRLH